METHETLQHPLGDDPVEQLNLFPRPAAAPPRPVAGVPDPAWPLVAQAAEEQGGGARRALWGRRALALVGAVGLATTLVPNRASALLGIPGIPDLVFDPAAVANLAATIARLETQITLVRNQYNAFVSNTRKLSTGYAWRDISSTLNNVSTVVSGGQALSYSTAGLAAQLGATFPGYSYDPATVPADMRAQKERALSTVMQQLLANQATGTQLATSVARLATIKGQVGSITTAQQAAEVNATIGVLGAEEAALLRQQLLAQGSAQAVVAAEALNQRLQATAAVAAFEAPAAAIAATPPTRPRMDTGAWTY